MSGSRNALAPPFVLYSLFCVFVYLFAWFSFRTAPVFTSFIATRAFFGDSDSTLGVQPFSNCRARALATVTNSNAFFTSVLCTLISPCETQPVKQEKPKHKR